VLTGAQPPLKPLTDEEYAMKRNADLIMMMLRVGGRSLRMEW
jgi:hypothetical protein